MALTDLDPARPASVAARIAQLRRWFGSGSHLALAQKVAGTAFLIRVASAALIYLSQILFARWMGTTEFGIYVYVWTWLLMLGALAPLGLAYLPQRFIPEYAARDDADGLRGFLRGARWLCFGLGTAASVIGCAVVLAFGDALGPHYTVPFLLALACLPIFTVSSTQESISNTYTWTTIALVPGYILRPVLILAILGAMHLAGMTIDAVAAMMAFLISVWMLTLLQTLLLQRRLAAHVEAGPRRYEVNRWMRTALPVLLIDGFFFLLTYIDILLLKLYVGADDIAKYYAASKTLALVAFINFAVSSACAHRFSEYHAAGEREKLADFVHTSTRMMFWPSLLMVGALALCGHWILMLFGPGFSDGYPIILILAVGLIARSAVGPAERLLNMVGQQKVCAMAYAAAVVVNIALCLTLIPRLGPTGAAVATASAVLVESALLFLAVRKRLGLTMFIGRKLFG